MTGVTVISCRCKPLVILTVNGDFYDAVHQPSAFRGLGKAYLGLVNIYNSLQYTFA